MATRRNPFFSSNASRVTAVVALLAVVVAIGGLMSLKSFAYGKLAPISLELVVTANEPQVLTVEYDYGFGFISLHSQQLSFASQSEAQVRHMTVSAWKTVRALRVRTDEPGLVQLLSTTVAHGDNVLRIVAPQPAAGGVLAYIPDLPTKLAKGSFNG